METNQEQQNESEGQQIDAMLTSNKPAEEQIVEEEMSLPDGVSDRTKEQFEKLKEKNRRLSDELKNKEEVKPVHVHASVLDDAVEAYAPQFKNLSQNQVEATAKALIDQEGYLDEKRLQQMLDENNRKVEEALDRAKKAEEKIATVEQRTTMERVHQKYPQLDPYHKGFNPSFYDFVKNDLLGQMVKGTKDVMSAAQRADKFFSQFKTQDNVVPNPEPKIVNQVGRSMPDRSNTGTQELTIAQRLKRSGY